MLCCGAVALGTPSLLQNLPRQQSNQDLDDDSSQDAEDTAAAGGAGSQAASASETSAVDGGDVSQGDVASSSHQVILRLLEDGETVSHCGHVHDNLSVLHYWQLASVSNQDKVIRHLCQRAAFSSHCCHMHNNRPRRQFSVRMNAQRLKHDSHPAYLAVTLDSSLSYREHLPVSDGFIADCHL